MDELQQLKLKKLQAMEAELQLRRSLPHLYSQKHYQWSWDFENDWTTKIQILCSANQIGKSTTLIKKMLRAATEPELWDSLWPDLKFIGQKPSNFWYLYPSKDVATMEYEEKWKPLLPQVPDDDPHYGWRPDFKLKYIHAIHFNNGINIYFKSYAQDVHLLQAGSVYFLGCDEEVPVEILPELQTRTSATNGLLHFAFTATRGQQYWKEVVEDKTKLIEARVWQVSLFDCQKHVDGTQSRWTPQRIQQSIDRCTTQAEIDRRIYGRFVVDAGRLFPTWDRQTHLQPWHHYPKEWTLYAGIDHGSGGATNHPAAITFIAVDPTMTKARVVKHWRGDKIQTTAQDVINKFIEMTNGIGMPQTAWFDYAAKDLGIIAVGMGLPFERADKAVELGSSVINLLLKQQALIVYDHVKECPFPDDHVQGYKIAEEMELLHDGVDKRAMKDDSVDSLRYAVSKLAFDFEMITGFKVVEPAKRSMTREEERMSKAEYVEPDPDNQTIAEEMEFWAELIE